MKKIEAIIRISQLQSVIDVLVENDFHGLTCTHVEGFGRQHGKTEVYRGKTVSPQFVDKVKIELVIAEDKLQKALDAIMTSARTGEVGDGKIFVSNIDNAYRIRTGEAGDEAL